MTDANTKAVLEVFTLIVAVILLFVFITIWARTAQTQCWRDTLKELDPITSPITGGLGKCIGREKFTVGVNLKSSCVESVDFTDFEGCKTICRGVGKGETSHIIREDCFEACRECQNNKGCIVAIPRLEGSYFKPSEIWTRFRSGFTTVTTYPTGVFGFVKKLSLKGPEKGVEVACLDFSKAKGEAFYTIGENAVDVISQCEVTECI